MAIIYAKSFIFAINKIAAAVNSKTKNLSENDKSHKDSSSVVVTILGKKLALPAATIAIREFLKELGED